jgi:hypothetical protein
MVTTLAQLMINFHVLCSLLCIPFSSLSVHAYVYSQTVVAFYEIILEFISLHPYQASE